MSVDAVRLTTGVRAAIDAAPPATRPVRDACRAAQPRQLLAAIAIAFGALVLGAVLYAVVRPHAAMFIPSGWHQPLLVAPSAPLANAVIGFAPTLLHAFAMGLLISATLGASTSRGRGYCCAAVCAVEIAFEIAQHPAIAAVLLGTSSSAAAANGPATALHAYLTRGTFDPLDLLAAFAGCLAAFAMLVRLTPGRLTSPGARHVAA